MYKIMNAEELTKLIATTEVGQEIAFAYEWDEGKTVDKLGPWDLAGWYGFKKVKAFEGIYVIIDYYGGGCDRCYNMLRGDYDKTLLEFVTEYLKDWLNSDTVCVELED